MADKEIGFAGLQAWLSDISSALSDLDKPPPATPSATSVAATAVGPEDAAGSSRGWLIFQVAIVVLVLGVIAMASISNSFGVPKEEPTLTEEAVIAPTTSPPAAIDEPMPASTSSPSVAEAAPPIGTDLELTANQIAYCLAEKLRLETEDGEIDTYNASAVSIFNGEVDDYNSRCGQYRYMPTDRSAAQSYVDEHRAEIVAQGHERARSASASPAPPADPVNPYSDLAPQ